MKSGLVAAIAMLATTPALAADLSIKAPGAPMLPPASWSGLYVGGNIGYGIGHNSTSVDDLATPPPVNLSTVTLSPAGAVGGGQIGYKWQWTPAWVIGVEADIQASGQKDSVCLGSFSCAADPSGRSLPTSLRLDQKINWFGTARATLGWANDSYLWYLTGGYAYGKVTSSTLNFVNPDALFRAGTSSNVRGGWTAGGGVETRLWQSNWSAKLEYLYVDLGALSYDMLRVGIGAGLPTRNPTTSSIHDHIVRVGLNYKFDWDTRVVARY